MILWHLGGRTVHPINTLSNGAALSHPQRIGICDLYVQFSKRFLRARPPGQVCSTSAAQLSSPLHLTSLISSALTFTTLQPQLSRVRWHTPTGPPMSRTSAFILHIWHSQQFTCITARRETMECLTFGLLSLATAPASATSLAIGGPLSHEE